MNDGLKVSGVIAGGVFMIGCCVALSVGSVVVLGVISGLWAWLGGLDLALSAGVALVVAIVAYGVLRGKKRNARTPQAEATADTTDPAT